MMLAYQGAHADKSQCHQCHNPPLSVKDIGKKGHLGYSMLRPPSNPTCVLKTETDVFFSHG